MACFHPLHGFRASAGGITWNRSESTGLPMKVACGQCIGCRLERSRQWAVRCVHEASLHEENCFLTLTYADDKLPADGSLDKSAFPGFMKRLRRRHEDTRIRYFHCGEYGERFSRPHYHACIFGFDFADKVLWTERNGLPVWRSPLLEELWPLGISEIGTLTFESAAYVARYITKKVTGSRAEEHYSYVDTETGEIREREPEYVTMSRRPGIGHGWFDSFANDVFPADEVVVRGQRSRPPRYYDLQLERADPEQLAGIKRKRAKGRNRGEERAERLQVRELCTKARMNLLPRSMEA